jgi:hypothetical protein
MSSHRQQPGSKPQPSAKNVSILNVTIAATQNRSGDLRAEDEDALRNRLTPNEIRALLDEVVLDP